MWNWHRKLLIFSYFLIHISRQLIVVSLLPLIVQKKVHLNQPKGVFLFKLVSQSSQVGYFRIIEIIIVIL